MGKSHSPGPAPDLVGAANAQGQQNQALLQQQTRANRPNQNTPFSKVSWVQGPDGQWTQTTSLNGGLGDAANALQQQASANLANPFDLSQFGSVGTGDQARNQAINAAYGQATSRLDPQWALQQKQLNDKLVNQGIAPGTAAYAAQMDSFNRAKNDAYSSAMNGAIGQGTAAGHTAFTDNMAARQQAISNALLARNAPLQELAQLQGFASAPGFNAAGFQGAPDLLGASQSQYQNQLNATQLSNQATSDESGGFLNLLKAAASIYAASDARLKRNIRRLPVEAYPGVPFATWEWLPGLEHLGPRVGVIAQDMEAVAPHYVHVGPDGFRRVDYSFLGV